MIKLTIGMPVFNDVDFVEQSIKSILNQTFTNFALIISDDASTDGSEEICCKLAQIDSRIQYIRHEKNMGISKNMEFLLSKSNSEFFMWAGDDDLYASDFISELINILENNKETISAFSALSIIDENNNTLKSNLFYNYENNSIYKRLDNYIKNSTDYFGYGIFRYEYIKNVKFPVWWYPNKKTPYNNIYPTLCYYLAKGNYKISTKNLFFKRQKSENKTNHIITGENNAIKESIAFFIRKFNLFCFTFKSIHKAKTFFFALSISPQLFYYWFVIPSWQQFLLAFRSFVKNKIK